MYAPSAALAAVAGLLLAVPAAAAERAAPQRVAAAGQPAEVRPAAVLTAAAAVDLPQALDKQPEAAPAPKRRAARVTSCRCGDTAAAAPAETPQR